MKGRVFWVQSTGGGRAIARERGRRYLPKWLPAEETTPLRLRRHVDDLQIGRTVLRRGRLSIRGRAGRGNTVTVAAADGRRLCSVRDVTPGTFIVRSSGGASATITR
ncbi:MAG: hypothetical protein HRU00_07430 [Myxococcales bacterium]|nr:hypothetical protein [Myxococcales bacterium]